MHNNIPVKFNGDPTNHRTRWHCWPPTDTAYLWDYKWGGNEVSANGWKYRCHWCQTPFPLSAVRNRVGSDPICKKKFCGIMNELAVTHENP